MKYLINVIVLAAGNSKRMNSKIPKILHKIGNFPIIEHILLTSSNINAEKISIVLDIDIVEQIKTITEKYSSNFNLICQKEKLGTGYATKLALQQIPKQNNEITVIIYGDTPLVCSQTINRMIASLEKSNQSIMILAFESQDEQYGKIVTDSQGNVIEIMEKNENSKLNHDFELNYLSNSGIIITHRDIIDTLIQKIGNNNKAQEYYLPDIISIANKENLKVGFFKTEESEAIGINNRLDIATAEYFFQQKMRRFMMNNGVTIISPENTFFSLDTKIDIDTIIHPYVSFGPGVEIKNNVTILPYSYLTNCLLNSYVSVGPFTHIKSDSIIESNCTIGNFVEISKSIINEESKIKHLSYIGNCTIGKNNNIGAGTIICNYGTDKKKYESLTGENCFIGGNSTLIAPLNIDNNSIIAAGSTIVENVPMNTLAIARKRQTNKPICQSLKKLKTLETSNTDI